MSSATLPVKIYCWVVERFLVNFKKLENVLSNCTFILPPLFVSFQFPLSLSLSLSVFLSVTVSVCSISLLLSFLTFVCFLSLSLYLRCSTPSSRKSLLPPSPSLSFPHTHLPSSPSPSLTHSLSPSLSRTHTHTYRLHQVPPSLTLSCISSYLIILRFHIIIFCSSLLLHRFATLLSGT